MRSLIALSLLAGCYNPPHDLPDFPSLQDGVPILTSEDDGRSNACAPDRFARVGCVIDGDTFDVGGCRESDAERIRMLGIDAPETAKPGVPAECGADRATEALEELIDQQVVLLSFDRECTGVFDRTLAYIEIDLDIALQIIPEDDVQEVLSLSRADEEAMLNVNVWMLWAGLAERYDAEWVEPLRLDPLLIAAQRLAQSQRRGIWADCKP